MPAIVLNTMRTAGPTFTAVLHTQLTANYGNITAANTIRDIVPIVSMPSALCRVCGVAIRACILFPPYPTHILVASVPFAVMWRPYVPVLGGVC